MNRALLLFLVTIFAACGSAPKQEETSAVADDKPIPTRPPPPRPAAATAPATKPPPARTEAKPAAPAAVAPESGPAPRAGAGNPLLTKPSASTIGWWFVYGGSSRFCGDSGGPHVTQVSYNQLMDQCRQAYGYARSLGGCAANADMLDKSRPEKGVRWKGAGGDAPILVLTEDEKDAYLYCEKGRGRGPAFDGGATPRGRELAIKYCEAQSGRKCRL